MNMNMGILTEKDLKEAIKLERRKQYEEDRKQRIFNAKQRLFGVSSRIGEFSFLINPHLQLINIP